MPTQGTTKNLPQVIPSQVTPSQVMEIIFVGAAMKDVCTSIMAHDVPVRARHMRSIDDLLMHIEDNHVECAVVDQSLPTESRGMKLVLLAGANSVKHLIVVAPQANRADIKSIEGIHQVLPSPATVQHIIDAVSGEANQVTAVKSAVAATDISPSIPVIMPATGACGFNTRFEKCRKLAPALASAARSKSPQHHWTAFTRRFATRPVIAAAASAFLCLGAVSAMSITSGSFMMPGEVSGKQAVVADLQTDPDKAGMQPDRAIPSLHQSMPALAAAELSRRDAKFRLQVSRQTIDLEISQQQKLKEQFLTHIARLKSITADLRATAGDDHPSQTTGVTYSLPAHTRAAVLEAELTLQELEVGKIDTFLTYLNLLKSGIDLPPAAGLKLADISPSKITE